MAVLALSILAVTRETAKPTSNSLRERSDPPPTRDPSDDITIYIGLDAADVTNTQGPIGQPERLNHKTTATTLMHENTWQLITVLHLAQSKLAWLFIQNNGFHKKKKISQITGKSRHILVI